MTIIDTMNLMQKKVVVIGGGIAGAAAAHRLAKRGHHVIVLEKQDRLGGRVCTRDYDGISVEMGAGFMTDAYQNVRQFLAENTVGEVLYARRDSTGIIVDGEPIDAGLPVILTNKVLSLRGKFQVVRLIIQILLKWRYISVHEPWKMSQFDDVSVAAMFGNKVDRRLLENVLFPILHGYFYWQPKTTSRAVLYEIIKALLRGGSHILPAGLQRIPEVATKSCEVVVSATVLEVRAVETGFRVRYSIDDREQSVQVDGVVFATTADVVPKIYGDISEAQTAFFERIRYSSTAVLAEVYRETDVFGKKSYAITGSEPGILAAVTSGFTEDKNERYRTIRAYAAGSEGRALCDLGDTELRQRLVEAAQQYKPFLVRDGAAPVAQYIQRWHQALPVYDVGYFKQLQVFRDGGVEMSSQSVVFAGDYLGGPFIEGAFTSGLQAADRLHGRLLLASD